MGGLPVRVYTAHEIRSGDFVPTARFVSEADHRREMRGARWIGCPNGHSFAIPADGSARYCPGCGTSLLGDSPDTLNCLTCEGTGAIYQEGEFNCPTCHGTGKAAL